MRCHICDASLGETEVKFNRKHDEFDPCGTCLTIIGEIFEDYVEPEEEKQVDEDEEILALETEE